MATTASPKFRLCLQVGCYTTNVEGVDKVKPEYLDVGTVIEIIPEHGGKFYEGQLNMAILSPTVFQMAKQFNRSKGSASCRLKMFDIKPNKDKGGEKAPEIEVADSDGIPY